MSQATDSPNVTRLSFSSAGAVRRRPSGPQSLFLPTGTPNQVEINWGAIGLDPAEMEDGLRPALPTRPLPLAQAIGTGFVPTIYHPERTAEYTRFERLIRKAKTTPAEALIHAERVIHYRHVRASEKRRRAELRSPQWFLEAAE